MITEIFIQQLDVCMFVCETAWTHRWSREFGLFRFGFSEFSVRCGR